MRITVDIDEAILEQLSQFTGEKKKSPAVAHAVTEFVMRARMKELGRQLRIGEFADTFEDEYNPEKFDI